MDSTSSSSSLSSKRKWHQDSSTDEHCCKKPKNDVFLNYSFEDIGNNFIGHLKGAFDRNSYTISDHTMVPVGRDARLESLKAIHESEIFVVVFSKMYASCVRCLDELVDIMDCLDKFEDRKVFPIFYKVEPYKVNSNMEESPVKSQQGSFMKAFHAHETRVDPETIQIWKKALKKVCQISGLTLQNGDEAEFLQKIVEEFAMMRSPEELHVTEHPVGIESRTEELISTLRLDCKDHVLVVGVSGISGIGKTTIVKEAYNRIAAKFNIRCFVANIHDLCQVPSWKVDLAKVLISCLIRNHKFSIMGNHNDCITEIKRLVSRQKALLVLDDVDNFQQLETLGINPAWFYKGSRIIITTRDKRSFGDIPYASYVIRLLNRRESFNLFTQLMVSTMNTKFIKEVVSHAGGIPLVLKIWSRHFKQCAQEELSSELKKLKRIPHGDIHQKLKMSYDSLNNRAKKLFLDISCFFIGLGYQGYEYNVVMKGLQDEERAFFPDKEFQILVDRSLVELEEGEHMAMHWAIRDMGNEIVRQENEDEPGQRTRLWMKSDVMRVLTECSGTESVESIIHLVTCEEEENVIVQLEALRKMSNLRLLHINYKLDMPIFFRGYDETTSPLSFHKLQNMWWSRFPFKSINHINMANVVVIRLKYSNLELLWEGMKNLKKLRILDVSYSEQLTKTGDFYGLENLEELIFFGCSNLKELHDSIDCLHKLAVLNLYRCRKLKKIPWEMIVKLSSLRQLILPDTEEEMHPFLSLLKEPLSLLQLHELNKIEANRCGNLASLPSNMSELKSLTLLDFSMCPKLGYEDPEFLMKVTGLTNLTQLTMIGCSVSQVPAEIGNLVSLKTLNLAGNTFCSLPDSLSNLSQLVDLQISGCSELQLLPLLPSNLTSIKAGRCGSLRIMPYDPMQTSYSFRSTAFKESTICKPLRIWLDWNKEIPGLCSYRNRGDTLSFVAPMNLDKKICGIILYTKCKMGVVTTKIFNKTKNTSRCLEGMGLGYDMQIMFYPLDDTTLVVEAGDTVELEFKEERPNSCRCGLRLIYDSDVVDSKLVLQPLNDIPYDANDDDSEYDSDHDPDCDSDYCSDFHSDDADDDELR